MLNWEWLLWYFENHFMQLQMLFRVSWQYWCDKNEQKDAFCFEITFLLYICKEIY